MPRGGMVNRRIRKILKNSSQQLKTSELPTLCRKFRWTRTSDEMKFYTKFKIKLEIAEPS
jgi:hypothetical protein